MDLIDLTHAITTGMPVYPGDPEVRLSAALTVPADGVHVRSVHMGSQTGTHVDAPCHIDDALPRLDDLPLTRFLGPAVVLDARDVADRAPIGPERLPDGLEPGTILLIATGRAGQWGTDGYLAHPYPSPELAERIVATGVRTVGVDALSVDRTPPPGDADFSLATHRVLLGAHAVIAENLTDLALLLDAQEEGRRIEVSLFPIRLQHDGAPVRAVARITDGG
ncbi:cyclase family protein [Actinomadura hibisca]|uniref:cyclase family protein n=1 Tax=Actinomadura hibisca TaxID=68565 RepID=UPI00082C3C59|nr:cyclase family protein [Actinomadura hibisca]